MRFIINAKVTEGWMEERTTEWETVAIARTRKEAIKKADELAHKHSNWSLCCVDTKTMDIIY